MYLHVFLALATTGLLWLPLQTLTFIFHSVTLTASPHNATTGGSCPRRGASLDQLLRFPAPSGGLSSNCSDQQRQQTAIGTVHAGGRCTLTGLFVHPPQEREGEPTSWHTRRGGETFGPSFSKGSASGLEGNSLTASLWGEKFQSCKNQLRFWWKRSHSQGVDVTRLLWL